MAPIEGDAHARNNVFAYAPFGGHLALVVGLTAHVLRVARRAAKALPPASSTRSQQPLRRRHAALFSTLAALSLASVALFAVMWRAISYVDWAQSGAATAPNALYLGDYGTGADGRWYLGDWIKDIDLQKESDVVAVSTAEGFLYTTQHFIGLMAASVFFGAEGHRRNLSASTIASFVVLGATGSLGYALSLFFVTILYTPLTTHKEDSPLHDALFTPSPVAYYLPIGLSLLFLYYLPDVLPRNLEPGTLDLLRWGKVAVPLLLAFAPQIVPPSLGRQHATKTAAHRSYSKVFHFLSIASFLLYWTLFAANVSGNTPKEHHHVLDVFRNSVGLKTDNSWSHRVLSGLSTTGQRLKHISKNPIISVTSVDVLFTAIALLAWTFTRDLDVDSILENSILAFFVPKHEKHVAFEDDIKPLIDNTLEPVPELQSVLETTTPRKRGRPAKNKTAVNGAPASLAGSIRRSAIKATGSVDLDSDAESTIMSRKARIAQDPDSAYQPSSKTKQEVAETEADGATAAADLIHSGESTGLALFLAFAGGLGLLASSALGAEVTGPQE
ncbi:hypothetical protein BDU57DRAFT_454824 [Ampelomyces quisqualis]|uniref:Uncharacterized protein n=1 Tax=Ampelomyces quisqualis TaxID=50730 RepID=A0A6A5QKQ2_AMPQU|nr:hypothetical protein BDU57DRAFT_454824 [Ampelomyces quisqualis]